MTNAFAFLKQVDMCMFEIIYTQVQQFGPETIGSGWSQWFFWKQYSNRKFSDFFRWFPTGSCWKAQEIDRNMPEKIRSFFDRNTASIFQRFPMFSCRIRWLSSIFPAESGGIRWPECSTWVVVSSVESIIFVWNYLNSWRKLYVDNGK